MHVFLSTSHRKIAGESSGKSVEMDHTSNTVEPRNPNNVNTTLTFVKAKVPKLHTINLCLSSCGSVGASTNVPFV